MKRDEPLPLITQQRILFESVIGGKGYASLNLSRRDRTFGRGHLATDRPEMLPGYLRYAVRGPSHTHAVLTRGQFS